MGAREIIGWNNQATVWFAAEVRHRRVDFRRIEHTSSNRPQLEIGCSGHDSIGVGLGDRGHLRIKNDANMGKTRHDLLEQLEPFRTEGRLQIGETRNIAPGFGKTCDKALQDWLADRREDDWCRRPANWSRCSPCRSDRGEPVASSRLRPAPRSAA